MSFSAFQLCESCVFDGMLAASDPVSLTSPDYNVVDPRVVYLRVHNVSDLAARFPYFSLKDLRALCAEHHIATTSKDVKDACLLHLLRHVCTSRCMSRIYVFRTLSIPRRCAASMHVDTIACVELRLQARKSKKSIVRQSISNPTAVPSRNASNGSHSSSPSVTPSGALAHDNADSSFPFFADDDLKKQIIREWQAELCPAGLQSQVCAVCGQRKRLKDISTMPFQDIEPNLLTNDYLPAKVKPSLYNFVAYGRAILHHKGLVDTRSPGDVWICGSCQTSVRAKRQPVDSLANFQYYGNDCLPDDVRAAFSSATKFDIMMVARCRASTITHFFVHNPKSSVYGGKVDSSQRYNRGNVAILPQDTTVLRHILPPTASEINGSMCALFIGGTDEPTKANIAKLSPVLVSKRRVKTMLDFLLENNKWYQEANVLFSEDNLNALYSDHTADGLPVNESVPVAVELAHLPLQSGDSLPTSTSDYTDRQQVLPSNDADKNLIVLEGVGFTATDSSSDFQKMKASALAWCLEGKTFVKVRAGSNLLSDKDPSFLSSVFPDLDAWGIGGFYNPLRTKEQYLTFARELRNLLLQDGSPFQNDPNFAFICWNIMQKWQITKSCSFSVPKSTKESIAADLTNLAPALKDLADKWEKNPHAAPTSDDEKRAVQLLSKLRMFARDVKGSVGYKLCRRNEVRSLIKKFSTPALFITLNPSDLNCPLMALLAGIPYDEWRSMTAFQRTAFVAKHPGLAAQFFDKIIRTFVDVVLRYGKGNGLFGKCSAYYGMVEAQGKGTLHCHMLIWLEGNPSPQELRDRMMSSELFKTEMFRWLESIISCELPGATDCTVEPESGSLPKPKLFSDIDPRLDLQPQVDDLSDEDFQKRFREFVHDLAVVCNWHSHTETCWKNLSKNDPRDDAHCRMRIDGSTKSFTELDEETQSILLRRLHPRINNFNDLVIFLLQGNMDIKYIGSGEAAKALVYYVTDYITKQTLPTHVGFSALVYALNQNAKKFAANPHMDLFKQRNSLFTKTVNSLASRQEMSHQQVMSYLIGGGDFYTSHSFRNLSWYRFDKHIAVLENTQSCSPDDAASQTLPSTTNAYVAPDEHDTVNFSVEDGRVSESSQIFDYQYRSTNGAFESLSLWEFVESVEMIKKVEEEARLARQPNRRTLPRGFISGEAHPNFETHMMRFRRDPLVPVLIGPALPKEDKSENEYEAWCRAMCILFKPWRQLQDLKSDDHAWSEAFLATTFKDVHVQYMKNMAVERQCKDARDSHAEAWRRERKQTNKAETFLPPCQFTTDEDSNRLRVQEAHLLPSVSEEDVMEDFDSSVSADDLKRSHAQTVVNGLEKAGLLCDPPVHVLHCADPRSISSIGSVCRVQDSNMDDISTQETIMSRLRKLKRPSNNDTNDNTALAPATKRRKTSSGSSSSSSPVTPYRDVYPSTRLNSLSDSNTHSSCTPTTSIAHADDASQSEEALLDIDKRKVDSILSGMGILDNPEQAMAVHIVSNHFLQSSPDQLLMYIAGVGGTGKSYVIKALDNIFSAFGCKNALLKTAPTGCAAVLIGGYTIHAVTMMSRNKRANVSAQLEALWSGVTYLVVDEVSMISALLMTNISKQISNAYANDPVRKDQPFGGVNVIFLGDMGQLPPVLEPCLFSTELVKKIPAYIRDKRKGQNGVRGAYLWSLVNHVVQLKKNWRSLEDAKFTNLLARMRMGIAWNGRSDMSPEQVGTGDNFSQSDYDVLRTRCLDYLLIHSPDEVRNFDEAPIIVTEKFLRDALNEHLAQRFATRTGQDLHFYYSEDFHKKSAVTGKQQELLWKVSSSVTVDALGRIPLVPGMRVMIVRENLAIQHKIVNGAEGTITDIVYKEDGSGKRYAVCAYVLVEGCAINIPGLPPDVVPILPCTSYFTYKGSNGAEYSITRVQLPLLPAYCYVDYKSQGRTLTWAIVDVAGCRSLQSLYVMLSRVKTLKGLAILRWFPPNKLTSRLQPHFRTEFQRIQAAHDRTAEIFCNL